MSAGIEYDAKTGFLHISIASCGLEDLRGVDDEENLERLDISKTFSYFKFQIANSRSAQRDFVCEI
jgi:hypothetical protein